MTIEAPRDFLSGDIPQQSEASALSLSNKLLSKLLNEVRMQKVTQRCVLQTQYSNPFRILDSAADTVDIRFMSSGMPILAQYLTISNNSATPVAVGLNEPVQENAALTFNSGILLAAGEIFHLPVSIEWLQLRLVTVNVGLGIILNNAPTGIPPNGAIQVYGWTHVNSDEDKNE